MIWLLAILPLLTAVFALINALTWPKGRSSKGRPARAVSFLVPMRNEAAHAEANLDAILQIAGPDDEILVFDDDSHDDTANIVTAIQAHDARVRLLPKSALPPRWVGKSYACHQLGEAARGEWLVFVDADVRLKPRALAHLDELARNFQADVVTMMPQQLMHSWAERLVVPWLHLSYVCWLPLRLIPMLRDARVLAANGQVMAMRRSAYETIGGHQAVCGSVVEDMAICRAAKRAGLTVVFADGADSAVCRMYDGASETIRGFAKNLCLGVGGPAALVVVSLLYIVAFLVPWLLLAASFLAPSLLLVGVVGVAANVFVRALAVTTHAHPWWSTFSHPFLVLVFLFVAARSWWWAMKGRVFWRDRSYGLTKNAEEVA